MAAFAVPGNHVVVRYDAECYTRGREKAAQEAASDRAKDWTVPDTTNHTPRIITIPQPQSERHQCQHTMRGDKGWRKRGYTSIKVGAWSRQCTNTATGKVRNRWKCHAHGGPST